MANTNDPDGFTPAYHMYGGVIRPARMRIQSAYDTAIYSGDMVSLTSGYITQGTASSTPVGVFYGVYYNDSSGNPTFSKVWTADTATLGSADAEAYVYSDPGIVYEAQFTAGTPTVAFIGSKYTLSTTAGDSNSGRSKEGVTATTSSGIALHVGYKLTPSNSIAAYARGFFTFPTSTFAV